MQRILSSLLLLFFPLSLFAFDKVVIWGHKLHSHTHSYVHNAFYRAFQYLGYETHWFDKNDDVSQFNFENTLFLVEGQVDQGIPLRMDCEYILHNCTDPKFRPLVQNNRAIILQVYTDDVLPRKVEKIAGCTYWSIPEKVLYMPWATDLLPEEIDENMRTAQPLGNKKEIYWIGTIGGGEFGNDTELDPFIRGCRRDNVAFIEKHRVSIEQHVQLIKDSYIAPAIVGAWQKRQGYIPCRIFKNISYGKFGVTNSARVNELFDGKLIYDPNPLHLYQKAKARLSVMQRNELLDLMEYVKDHHTYINRIQLLLEFLELCSTSTRSEL